MHSITGPHITRASFSVVKSPPHCRVPTAGRPPGRAARATIRFRRINLDARAGEGEKTRSKPRVETPGRQASRAPPPLPMPVPKPMERKQAAYSNLVRILFFHRRGLLHSLVDHLWSQLNGCIGDCRMRGTRSRGRSTRGSSTAISTSRASTTCGISSTPSSPPGSRNSLVRPNSPLSSPLSSRL
jgi:hypothetical protein